MSRRLFVAVEPSDACRELLTGTQATLADRFPSLRVRWQPTDNLHLTLAFLGNVADARVAETSEQVERMAAIHQRFSLTTTRLGAFPSPLRPSVLWLGAKAEPPDALAHLQRDVADAFRYLRDDRKPFRPHLTLGRVKGLGSTPRDEFAELLARLPTDRVSWTVHGLVLFESRLTPDGAVHTPVRVGTLAQ